MGINLVTLAEVKTYANISSNTQDAIINQLITQISEYIKTYCNRTFVDFVNDSKVDIFSGGNSCIYLPESPTISIQSVEFTRDYGVTYTTLVENTEWVWDLEKDVIRPTYTALFPKQINGYKITYTAGYEVLPVDLKLAVLDVVLYYLKSDMAIKSNAAMGKNSVAIEYITTSKFPSHITRVLDFYIQELN